MDSYNKSISSLLIKKINSQFVKKIHDNGDNLFNYNFGKKINCLFNSLFMEYEILVNKQLAKFNIDKYLTTPNDIILTDDLVIFLDNNINHNLHNTYNKLLLYIDNMPYVWNEQHLNNNFIDKYEKYNMIIKNVYVNIKYEYDIINNFINLCEEQKKYFKFINVEAYIFYEKLQNKIYMYNFDKYNLVYNETTKKWHKLL